MFIDLEGVVERINYVFSDYIGVRRNKLKYRVIVDGDFGKLLLFWVVILKDYNLGVR